MVKVYMRHLIVLQKDPEIVGLHVWRGKEGRDVETGEL